VDDGSKDGTGDAFKQQLKPLKNAEVKILSKNGGKGMAIRQGFQGAKEDRLMFMDGDLAYSIDHLIPLAESLNDHDVVIGSRSMAPQAHGGLPARRAFLGWGFNRFLLSAWNRLPRYPSRLEGVSTQSSRTALCETKAYRLCLRCGTSLPLS